MNVMNTIKAIIILQMDGRRTLATYYDETLNSRQFERRLFAKTKTPKAKDEILAVDGVLVVHKFNKDSHIYVVGSRSENPLVLDSVSNCLVEVIKKLSSDSSLGNTVLDNLKRVILALDEMCDGGMILEVDHNLVIDRIKPTSVEEESSMASTAKRFFGI